MWDMTERAEKRLRQQGDVGTDPEADPSDGLVMAHVLFMDIVGYSKLIPMERQRRALRQLQSLVCDTQEFKRAEQSGRLLCLPTGDGMALVFLTPTPIEPVRCAIELGRALRAGGGIPLRMGIHSGPVYAVADIRANKNVVGGGINIAQRVMDCGDAGHILLSKSVADVLDQVGGWAESLHDLGAFKVKHGLAVHVFNLCTDECGNRELPRKYRRARALRRGAIIILVSALLAGVSLLSLRTRQPDKGPHAFPKSYTVWAYQRTLVGHSDTVYSIAFSSDGRTVAGGSYDRTIILWDAQSGTSQRTLSMSDKSLVYTVALSPMGGTLAAGVGQDVLLRDTQTGSTLRTLKGHTGFVFAVAFAPDGRLLASGSQDHTVRIWDAQTGQTLRTLAEHTDEVNAVAFSGDGRLLASGSYDKTIILWDVDTWAVKTRLIGHAGHVYSVAFAPDGQTVASGGEDGTVRLWDVRTGTLKQTLYQHQGAVNSVTFAPDGATIASAGSDGKVLLWDALTGTVQQTLDRHTGSVTSVAFAPDERTLASGGKDKTVILWGAQTGTVAPGVP